MNRFHPLLRSPVFLPAVLICLLAAHSLPVLAGADIHLLQYDGPITPVASEYILTGMEASIDRDAEVVIIQLDTPGGLDTDMRQIIKAILGSPIPVIVYVGPGGSRAASAGAFITLSAHVAAMAPGTNIGSASPVQMMGAGMDSTMARKVTNDAAAYIASIAEQKGRNVEMARSFVEEANNITAEEALNAGIIEILTPAIDTLLEELHGRDITVDGEQKTLHTRDRALVRHPMGMRLEFLKRLVNPNVAYLLFLLGVYGLFFELSNPGSVVPGVLGAISILLALYAFHALPVDYTGMGLILLGVVMLILEVKVPSFGVLSLGGVASLVLGSTMLFKSSEPWATLSMKVMVPSVLVFVGFIGLCVALVIRGQRRKPVTGLKAMVGESGRMILPCGGGKTRGKAFLHGEIWDVMSDEDLPCDTMITVLKVDGRVAWVRKTRPSENQPSPKAGG